MNPSLRLVVRVNVETPTVDADAPRPRRAELLALSLVALVAIACDPAPPSEPPATPAALLPGISIDETWSVQDGEWTFTGRVDPEGDPTDVVLEIGPGPETLRQFDTTVGVATDLLEPEALTISTRNIPDVETVCVRFKATNSGGTSTSRPFCFPHDLPSIGPPAAPEVFITNEFTVEGGQWTFRARIDPMGAATRVVLEVGPGPESAPVYDTQVPVIEDLTEPLTLEAMTDQIPDGPEACVRFTATNAAGSTQSAPVCFAPGG